MCVYIYIYTYTKEIIHSLGSVPSYTLGKTSEFRTLS